MRIVLAEKERLYLDLTGLGCYHKKDVTGWYDKLAEKERWDVQARFWEAVAGRCAKSPAIFCYDLMNEPVVPGGKRNDGGWLTQFQDDSGCTDAGLAGVVREEGEGNWEVRP